MAEARQLDCEIALRRFRTSERAFERGLRRAIDGSAIIEDDAHSGLLNDEIEQPALPFERSCRPGIILLDIVHLCVAPYRGLFEVARDIIDRHNGHGGAA